MNPAELELTFGVAPLYGWRVWRVRSWQRRDGSIEPRLAPLSADLAWQPGRRVEAVCNYSSIYGRSGESHDAPWLGCDCGLWAMRTRQEAETLAGSGSAPVFGKVALWGRVLEFQRGFRAEFGYPAELYVYDNAELAAHLQRIYRVPARAIEAPWTIRGLASAHHITVSPSAARVALRLPPPPLTVPASGDLFDEAVKAMAGLSASGKTATEAVAELSKLVDRAVTDAFLNGSG